MCADHNLLQVRELNVQYCSGEGIRHQAVEGVSFDIGPGEVVGLMGESGCGKTTIALSLLGLLPNGGARSSGSIQFRGQELLALNERAYQKIRGAGISMVHQEPGNSLSPVLRVGDQVTEVMNAHRDWSWKRCRAEAESLIARVGLPGTDRIFSAYPHQLSGGQLQRIVLAQALACEPAILVADEPTASLDARSQASFLVLLRELKEQFGLGILLISHTPEIQASLADRLLVMKDGQIVEEGSFGQLYRRPTHPYTRTMLRRKSVAEGNAEPRQELVAHGERVR
ncbi:MAG: ABC transporter ATP-binding protein [Candidatus Acidiferrales bacterium]